MNDTIAYMKATLGNHFKPEEVRSLTHLIMREVCGLEPHQLLLDKDTDFSDAVREEIRMITERLINEEPIQYILGKTSFYGYNFIVTPAVLIPRPETEELVDYIVRQEDKPGLTVLDIGTGSGCIAISLAKSLKSPNVTAIDISEKALEVASLNAKKNQAEVNFIQSDILKNKLSLTGKLDILVSNPPYVLNQEKEEIHKNVLQFEPHTALFVPDNDPLLFYRAIAEFGLQNLTDTGRIYFEINSALGEETKQLLLKIGFSRAILLQDLSGKDRIIKAIK